MAQRVVQVYLYSSMTAALERGECSAARPGRTLPPGKTRYPFYRRLGGPQGRSGQAENLVPTGIRSRTVQPVAQSLYRLSNPAHAESTRICHEFCFPCVLFFGGGAFVKLPKRTSFVMSVRLSFRTEKLYSNWADFHEI